MEHRYRIQICYADTDAGGVVYHGRYVEFCERARWQWFRDHGLDLVALGESGCLFVISGIALKYRRPGKLGDELEIRSQVREMRSAYSLIQQNIFRSDTNELLCEAEVKITTIGKDWRPIRTPDEVRSVFESYIEEKE